MCEQLELVQNDTLQGSAACSAWRGTMFSVQAHLRDKMYLANQIVFDRDGGIGCMIYHLGNPSLPLDKDLATTKRIQWWYRVLQDGSSSSVSIRWHGLVLEYSLVIVCLAHIHGHSHFRTAQIDDQQAF